VIVKSQKAKKSDIAVDDDNKAVKT